MSEQMNIDAAAERLCTWMFVNWSSLPDGRVPEEFGPCTGNRFQGRRDDVRDIVREIVRVATASDGEDASR